MPSRDHKIKFQEPSSRSFHYFWHKYPRKYPSPYFPHQNFTWRFSVYRMHNTINIAEDRTPILLRMWKRPTLLDLDSFFYPSLEQFNILSSSSSNSGDLRRAAMQQQSKVEQRVFAQFSTTLSVMQSFTMFAGKSSFLPIPYHSIQYNPWQTAIHSLRHSPRWRTERRTDRLLDG